VSARSASASVATARAGRARVRTASGGVAEPPGREEHERAREPREQAARAAEEPAVRRAQERQVEGRAHHQLDALGQERIHEVAEHARRGRERRRRPERPAALRAAEERAAEEALGGEHVGAGIVGERAQELPGRARADRDAEGERRRDEEVAAEQGGQIAAEVRRLLAGELVPLAGAPAVCYGRIELLFDTLPTRAEWEERVKGGGPIGYHAQVQLARLDRGEALQTKISYPIQTFSFGDRLAMVFLPGEVVVDYSLRLKRELGGRRIWVNAYSNDLPCYIPSERVLQEGGYEGGGAMVYFDRPTRLKPGLEQTIVDTVQGQLGAGKPAAT